MDCDASCNSTSYLNATGEVPEKTIVDCLNGDVSIKDVIRQVSIPETRGGRDFLTPIELYIIPSDIRVEELEFDDLNVIRDMIAEVEQDYDYCIFDCPSQKTSLTLVTLCACEHILIPVNPEIDSVGGYGMMSDLVAKLRTGLMNERLSIVGVVMNRIKPKQVLDNYIHTTLSEGAGKKVFLSSIRDSALVAQARYFTKPLCYFRPTHPVTQDIQAVTKELITKINSMERGK